MFVPRSRAELWLVYGYTLPRNRPTLVVDADDVIFQFMLSILMWKEPAVDWEQDLANITHTDFSLLWRNLTDVDVTGFATEDEGESPATRLVRMFMRDYGASLPLVDKAQWALRILHRHFNLVVVTTRSQRFERLTVEAIDRHLRSRVWKTRLIADVKLVGNRGPTGEAATDKITVVRELKPVGIIDDRYSNVLTFAHEGIWGFLFGAKRYGWSLGGNKPLPTVYPVADWVKLIRVIAQLHLKDRPKSRQRRHRS